MARGFASLSREKLLLVSSKGGKSVPAEKRAFSHPEVAAKAGRIGGKRLVKKGFAVKEKSDVDVG